jgi:DNA-binding MarR family transcriptional regulator
VWTKDYESLNSNEKDELRRIGNYLLSHTYLTRYMYAPSEQMTLPNKDYQIATRFFSILQDYFAITGWQLNKDDNYGFISLISKYDNNHFRLDQFTTLFLYSCRLIYEEQREQASSFHTVITSTSDIVKKMETLGLLEMKKGKTSTQKQRLEAQRTLAHFNVIQKMEASAWEPDGNRILILPSILAIISNQGINDIVRELEEIRSDFELGIDDLGNVGQEGNEPEETA